MEGIYSTHPLLLEKHDRYQPFFADLFLCMTASLGSDSEVRTKM